MKSVYYVTQYIFLILYFIQKHIVTALNRRKTSNQLAELGKQQCKIIRNYIYIK